MAVSWWESRRNRAYAEKSSKNGQNKKRKRERDAVWDETWRDHNSYINIPTDSLCACKLKRDSCICIFELVHAAERPPLSSLSSATRSVTVSRINAAPPNADRSRTHTLKMVCVHAVRVCVDDSLAARSTAHCVELFGIQYGLICIRCDNIKIHLSRAPIRTVYCYWQVVW